MTGAHLYAITCMSGRCMRPLVWGNAVRRPVSRKYIDAAGVCPYSCKSISRFVLKEPLFFANCDCASFNAKTSVSKESSFETQTLWQKAIEKQHVVLALGLCASLVTSSALE